ncbi:MAG: hypothetical protein WCL50_01740 [Spirochaetota bacterium]
MMKKLFAIVFVAVIGCGSIVWGQADSAARPFKAGVNLGTDVLATGPGGTSESWTQIGFQPDVAFGKFGVGLNLTLHFQIYPVNQPDQAVAIYPGDWVPNYQSNGQNIVDLYLPKILYVRYGLKGVDPLFVKVGSIPELTLGNGFIMGNYTNMSYFPDKRITGLDFGLDGSMFEFPYVGIEFITGNLARFDVIGTHVLGRPLIWSDIPIVKNLQIGLTFVTDTAPGLYSSASLSGVSVYGFDALVPLISNPMVSMAAFTETAFEPNSSAGFMLGLGGRLVGIITYGAQVRLLGAGFIPNYFDANYDLFRADKATYMATKATGNGFMGWFASLGTVLLNDMLYATASLDGPVKAIDKTSSNKADFPHARAIAHLGEGLLPGIYADATYEKYSLGKLKGFFEDLVDPTDAIVGLAINYKTGSSVLTLLYNAKWLEGTWKVSSSLQASVKF